MLFVLFSQQQLELISWKFWLKLWWFLAPSTLKLPSGQLANNCKSSKFHLGTSWPCLFVWPWKKSSSLICEAWFCTTIPIENRATDLRLRLKQSFFLVKCSIHDDSRLSLSTKFKPILKYTCTCWEYSNTDSWNIVGEIVWGLNVSVVFLCWRDWDTIECVCVCAIYCSSH